MITLKEALEIAVKKEKKWRRLDAETILFPQTIHETSDYWLFDFQDEEEKAIPGGGSVAVYKADGKTWCVGSGQIPEFYEGATPVPLPQ